MFKHALVAFVLLNAGCAVATSDEASSTESASAASLSPADAAAVLALVNYPGTDEKLLDTGAKLDSRAARDIIAHRNGADGVAPSADDALFTTIASLDAIAYVGDATLQKLHTYAAAHPAPSAESVEGVDFAGWQSESVVWGVNHATVATLDGLIDDRAARALIAKRPFTTVAQMGPVSYVGKTALEKLRGQAQTWWTSMHGSGTGPSTCATTFQSAITPHLASLLFMSESDRPFDVVVFPGAGTSAPTAASVLATVGASAGSTSELRAVDNYYVALEPADSADVTAVQAVFTSQLHNVVYVAVFAPVGSIDRSLVDVYLVGQTTCGDLVGIHAIAVET